MKHESFSIQQIFSTTPNELFASLTDGTKIKQWSGQAGAVEATIGGRAHYFGGWVKGTVLAFEPGKRLVFTWLPTDWPAGTQASIVICSLKPTRTGTRLRLQHTGLPSPAEAVSHRSGWKEHVFDPLADHFRQLKGKA